MDADERLDAAVGSVAQEATKLLEALARSRAPRDEDVTGPDDAGADGTSTTPPVSATPPADQDEHVHVAMGDAESCSWCPVCRSVTLLRGVSPETLGRLADLATTAATVLADLASRHTESSSATADARPTERTPRTESITVIDEEELS